MNITFAFSILLNGIHFAEEEREASWQITTGIGAIVIMMVLSNVTFCRTALRDPGIIPKMSDRSSTELAKYKAYQPFETRFALEGWKIFYM